jgi:hypothetical protein
MYVQYIDFEVLCTGRSEMRAFGAIGIDESRMGRVRFCSWLRARFDRALKLTRIKRVETKHPKHDWRASTMDLQCHAA